MKLSVIIPVYNEKNTIQKILRKIEEVNYFEKQIIIIDDGSTDGTYELIKNFGFLSEHKIIRHSDNSGKGSAIKSSINYISGDVVIIQDGDLEYDPSDYKNIINPLTILQYLRQCRYICNFYLIKLIICNKKKESFN